MWHESTDHLGNKTWSDSLLMKPRWVLREIHERRCACSYCRESSSLVGIKRPEVKDWNSWTRMWFRTSTKTYYLRWTPKLPDPLPTCHPACGH